MQGNGRVNQFMDAISQPKAAKACSRKDQAIKLAGVKLLQAGNHIAPHVLEREVRVVVSKLCQTAQGAGANNTALGEGCQRFVLVLGMHHQGISGIFPLGDATQHQPIGEIRR